jgi:ribosomal-protein-serine acetyltransferase
VLNAPGDPLKWTKNEVQLATGRLVLRPVRAEDAGDFFAALRESIPEISPWMDWCTPEYSPEMAQAWASSRPEAWDSGTAYCFAIRDAQDGSLLGGCNLSQIQRNVRLANLSYWVRTSRTRQGVASAATRLVARFGIEQVGLIRVEVLAAVENLASQRTAEKAGARREGVLRNRLVVRDRIYEAVMFSLIPEDLEERGRGR